MKPLHAYRDETIRIAESLSLDLNDFDSRKDFLNFTDKDVRLLSELSASLRATSKDFVDMLHERIDGSPETRAVLSKTSSIEWLRNRHAEYFAEMAEGGYDMDYVLNRLAVGLAHQKIGLKPKWFLGSFSLFLEWIIPRIMDKERGDLEKAVATILSVVKISLLDAGLALDAYFQADKEMLALLSRVFETDIEVVWIMDTGGRILHANRTAERILGWTPSELRGRGLDEFCGPVQDGTPGVFSAIGDRARTAGFWEGEMTFFRKDGTSFPAWGTLNTVQDPKGDVTHFIIEFRDRTQEKAVQDELARRTEDLVRSNRDLEQFAYVASHDLQEPLRMVTSYTQLLARRYKGQLSSEADEFIGFAVDGAIRMQSLINALLAYSRVGTRGKDFGPVSSRIALEQALANLRLSIEESGARISSGDLPTVTGDAVQLMLLFQNLVGNAIKFQKPGVVPEVAVSAEFQGDEWTFTVSDNGIGIDPRFWERIFVIFQRLHSKEEFSGTGIGLAMCKKIVERHGGRIWLASEPGSGSRFSFTLKAGPHPGPGTNGGTP